MKMMKKTFAFILMLALVLASININAFTVSAEEVAEAKLTSVNMTKPEPLSASGGKKAFKLVGTNLKLKDTKAKVIVKGNTEDITSISSTLLPVNLYLEKEKAYSNFNVNLDFPANDTTEDKVYVVSFSVDNGKTFYDKKIDGFETGKYIGPIEVTVKGKSSTEPEPGTEPKLDKKPIVDQITVFQKGDMVSLTITGKDLTGAKFKTKTTLEDGSKPENYIETEWITLFDNTSSKSILLPVNNTDKDIIYKIFVSINGGETYLEDKAITVTVPKKTTGDDTEVTGVAELDSSVSEKKLSKEGGEVNLFVNTKKTTMSDKIKAKITEIADNGEIIAYGILPQIEAKTNKSKSFKFSANFPENTGKKAKEYKIVFNAKGSDTEFQTEPAFKVFVEGTGTGGNQTETVIKLVRASIPGLPKTGGESKISVIGENIDISVLEPVITKTVEGKSVIVKLKTEKFGTKRAAAYTITFPPAASDKVESYEINIGGKTVTVTVGGRVSGSLLDIFPSKVYTNKDKTVITIYYDEEIYTVAEDYKELKEGITLQANDYGTVTERKLGKDDKIVIEGNKIIITLSKPFEGGFNSRLVIEERLLKNEEGFEAKKINPIIDIAKPIVNSSVFTKGEVLTKEGGEIEIKLIGEGFVQSVAGKDKAIDTLVKVLENNKEKTVLYDVEKKGIKYKNSDKIKVTTNETGTEQTISFTLPANDTDKTKTYSAMVSLDEGKTFSAAIGVNILENRAKRLVASVLPTDINDGKPHLSFMSITSYGTQGGGKEIADITHTETPNGQESKKTWVTAFGANFDKKLTKVRIVDRNGIIWYPLQNEGTSDSTSNFIMVSSDGTGIFGNGNTQMLEIIGMNNIATTETFKYQLAVDGENYDTDTIVTATVPYDGAPKNTKVQMTDEFIQKVKVSHVTKEGDMLEAAKEVRGYSWSKLRSFGIRDKKFDKCSILGYRKNGSKELIPITGLYEELIGKLDKVEFVYDKAKDVPSDPGTYSPVIPADTTAPGNSDSQIDITESTENTPLGNSEEAVKQLKSKTKQLSSRKTSVNIGKDELKTTGKEYDKLNLSVKNGRVTLSLKEVNKVVKGNSYIKISKVSNNKEIKKVLNSKKILNLVKVLENNKIYEVKLIANGKRIAKTLTASTIALKTAKKLTGSIYAINLKTGTKIKAKYDSKTKSVIFKTKELGNFVIVKNIK